MHKRPGGCHSWPYRSVQYSLIIVTVLLITVWLGAEYEQYQVRNAPSTVDLYQGNQVCGILLNSSGIVNGGIEIETFASVAEFTSNNEPDDNKKVVAHC